MENNIMKILTCCVFLLLALVAADDTFPEDFSWGVATAAYQVEGGWNADDKGENIWDYMLHLNPGFVWNNQNGDVACDTYTHAVEDVEILKAMGVNHYRFSIAWTRILPTGKNDYISEAGVRYYNNLINALIDANIKPLVTLHHWDLPQSLEDQGGFLSQEMPQWFEDYARVCFEKFGDRVKNWVTFNEPITTCRDGYESGDKAPSIKNPGTGAYECAHQVLLSHGKAYRLYEREFKSNQNGRVSIVIDTSWYDPKTDSDADREAANRNLIFNYEWWMMPLYQGDYPELIKTVVAENSREEGLPKSRLPEFTDEQKAMLKGSYDFVSLNQYTTYRCTPGGDWSEKTSSWWRDIKVDCDQPDDWKPGSGWLRVTPWGMKSMLEYIRDRYDNPEVIITENGYSDGGELKDEDRTYYHRAYIEKVLEAINDGCNVKGYTAWSFLDDFEWTAGYLAKFGLVRIDFDAPERTRTRKYFSYVYENIIKTRKVDWNYVPDWPGELHNSNQTITYPKKRFSKKYLRKKN